jgi:WD40 repeat protein
MQAFKIPKSAYLPASSYYRQAVEFTSDGRYLGINSHPFTLIDTQASAVAVVNLESGAHGHRFVRDHSVAALSSLYELFLYDFRGRCSATVDYWRRAVPEDLAVSPDGKTLYLLARLSGEFVAEIWVLSAATLKRRYRFARHETWPHRLVISANGQRLASDGGQTVRVWVIRAGTRPNRAVKVKPKGEINAFALSGDGARLATATGRGLTIWNTSSGKQVAHSGKHKRSVTAVAWNPTRPVVVTGDNAGQIFVWDDTGRVLTRYDWKLKEVYGLCFAPDGLRCAAVDASGKVVVWDVDV